MQQHLLFNHSRKHVASLALMMTEVSERSSSLKKFCTVRRQSATIAALIKCWPPLGAVRASRILLAHFWSSTSPTFVMLQRNRITPGNNEKILNNGLVKLSNLWPAKERLRIAFQKPKLSSSICASLNKLLYLLEFLSR